MVWFSQGQLYVTFCRTSSFKNIVDSITEGCRQLLENDGFITSNNLRGKKRIALKLQKCK
jgi:hypothetical protein